MNTFTRLVRHLWLDADDAHRALGADALQRLETRINDSERRHAGEICLCVEASLPVSYLWRHLRHHLPIEQIVRERALALFGKLRVWDTELNNGVLIYLLLAEHCIEIVADRGLARQITETDWRQSLADITPDFRAGRHEAGLARAIDTASLALERHFPATGASPNRSQARENQLPNRPTVR